MALVTDYCSHTAWTGQTATEANTVSLNQEKGQRLETGTLSEALLRISCVRDMVPWGLPGTRLSSPPKRASVALSASGHAI